MLGLPNNGAFGGGGGSYTSQPPRAPRPPSPFNAGATRMPQGMNQARGLTRPDRPGPFMSQQSPLHSSNWLGSTAKQPYPLPSFAPSQPPPAAQRPSPMRPRQPAPPPGWHGDPGRQAYLNWLMRVSQAGKRPPFGSSMQDFILPNGM